MSTGRIAELTNVIETLSLLPEKIVFKPGVNFVFGENGAGKTTLTQAIYAVPQARHVGEAMNNLSGKELDDFVSSNMGIEGMRYAYFLDGIEGTISPISAAALSSCIHVGETSDHVGRYNDFTTRAGQAAAYRSIDAKNKGGISFDSMNPEQSMSHGQSNLKALREIFSGDYGGLMIRGRDADGNVVVFLEEPENGLDPKNHRKLIDNLLSIAADPDNKIVFIINTNSVLAYEDPNFPRINLWEPAKGVFTPANS